MVGSTKAGTVVRTARLSGGGYVVSWLYHDLSANDGSPYQVCFARLDASARAVGASACVQGAAVPYTVTQSYVIPRPDGGFVIAWFDASASAVKSQAFDAAGNAIGGIQAGPQQPVDAKAAALVGGGYVTLSMQPGGGQTDASTISFQRYSSDGTPIGQSTSVGDSGGFSITQVVPLTGGGFAVAWLQGAGNPSVMTRMFTADGTPVGAPMAASDAPLVCSTVVAACAGQTFLDLAPMNDGGYAVVWTSGTGQTAAEGTFARRFGPDGTPGASIGRISDFPMGGDWAANGSDGLLLASAEQSDPMPPARSDIYVTIFDSAQLR